MSPRLAPPLALLCLAAILPGSICLAQPSAPRNRLEDLTARLSREQAWLLDPADRARMDELNRRLREAQTRGRGNSASQPGETIADATAQVLKLLDNNGRAIRITLGDKSPEPARGPDVTMPGDTGALLLRVSHGEGPAHALVVDNDMSQNSSEGATVVVDLAGTGTTWVLIALDRVPTQRSSLMIEFKRDGKSLRWPMDVRAPAFGRFIASIQSEDTGKSTPAMVRMIWKDLDAERHPGNAIEFAPQFDQQGFPTGRRRMVIPGHRSEYYWCVPDPIDTELPPGEYEIKIMHGQEFVPITDTFTIESGKSCERRYTVKRWVDMRKLGWYSGDDHVHCQILSNDDATRLMAWAQAEDIHVANVVKMGDINRTWFEQRGWGKAYRAIAEDIILSPGQECPRTHEIGHTLSMNTTAMNRDTDHYYIYEDVADAAHAQGGLWGYAHVISKMFHVERDMSINVPKGKCDFIELMQFGGMGTELYYDFLNLGFKMTASAGSDVPWGGSIGEVRVYGYLGKETFTADAWFDAVKKGRTFTTNGPMIDFHVDDALPGDEIKVDSNRKLHVRARAWGSAQRTLPSKLEIVCNGEVLKRADSSADGQEELTLNFETDTGNGFWIAARAYGHDGTVAHTTPVYVIRQGLRFWRYDRVSGLLRKRITSLNEVQTLVDQATRTDPDGNPGDRTRDQLSRQGPELLKRVAAARKIYDDLKEVAEQERPLREKKD